MVNFLSVLLTSSFRSAPLCARGWIQRQYARQFRSVLSGGCCNEIWKGRVSFLTANDSSRLAVRVESRGASNDADYFFTGAAAVAGGGAMAGALARTAFTAAETLSAFASKTLTCHNCVSLR